jgi:hypothetical protein
MMQSLASKIDSADNLINTIVKSNLDYDPFKRLDELRKAYETDAGNKTKHVAVVSLMERRVVDDGKNISNQRFSKQHRVHPKMFLGTGYDYGNANDNGTRTL